MNRRKIALAVVVADVAEHGEAGRTALRAYIETRMSRASFNEAIRTGRSIYERAHPEKATPVRNGYWTRA